MATRTKEKSKERRTARFEMLMTPSEAASLKSLAAKHGSSMAKVMSGLIMRSAKRQKCAVIVE